MSATENLAAVVSIITGVLATVFAINEGASMVTSSAIGVACALALFLLVGVAVRFAEGRANRGSDRPITAQPVQAAPRFVPPAAGTNKPATQEVKPKAEAKPKPSEVANEMIATVKEGLEKFINEPDLEAQSKQQEKNDQEADDAHRSQIKAHAEEMKNKKAEHDRKRAEEEKTHTEEVRRQKDNAEENQRREKAAREKLELQLKDFNEKQKAAKAEAEAYESKVTAFGEQQMRAQEAMKINLALYRDLYTGWTLKWLAEKASGDELTDAPMLPKVEGLGGSEMVNLRSTIQNGYTREVANTELEKMLGKMDKGKKDMLKKTKGPMKPPTRFAERAKQMKNEEKSEAEIEAEMDRMRSKQTDLPSSDLWRSIRPPMPDWNTAKAPAKLAERPPAFTERPPEYVQPKLLEVREVPALAPATAFVPSAVPSRVAAKVAAPVFRRVAVAAPVATKVATKVAVAAPVAAQVAAKVPVRVGVPSRSQAPKKPGGGGTQYDLGGGRQTGRRGRTYGRNYGRSKTT